MSYEFESMSYAQMINNARESLDFGTKEAYEESELNEYFSFSDDEDEDFDWGYPKDEDGFYILPDDGDYEMSYQNNLSYEDTTEFENYFDRDLDDLDDDYDDEEIF